MTKPKVRKSLKDVRQQYIEAGKKLATLCELALESNSAPTLSSMQVTIRLATHNWSDTTRLRTVRWDLTEEERVYFSNLPVDIFGNGEYLDISPKVSSLGELLR